MTQSVFEYEFQTTVDNLEAFGISNEALNALGETLTPSEKTVGEYLVGLIPEHPALKIITGIGNYSNENRIATRLINEKMMAAIYARDPIAEERAWHAATCFFVFEGIGDVVNTLKTQIATIAGTRIEQTQQLIKLTIALSLVVDKLFKANDIKLIAGTSLGNELMMQEALDQGANLPVTCPQGKKAIDYAIMNNQIDAVRFLTSRAPQFFHPQLAEKLADVAQKIATGTVGYYDFYYLGEQYARVGQANEAERSYQLGIAMAPAHLKCDAHYHRGQGLEILGKPDLAIRAYEDGLHSHPSHIDGYKKLATLYRDPQFHDPQLAEKLADVAQKIATGTAGCQDFDHLGYQYANAGFANEANRSYQHSITVKTYKEYQAKSAEVPRTEKNQTKKTTPSNHDNLTKKSPEMKKMLDAGIARSSSLLPANKIDCLRTYQATTGKLARGLYCRALGSNQHYTFFKDNKAVKAAYPNSSISYTGTKHSLGRPAGSVTVTLGDNGKCSHNTKHDSSSSSLSPVTDSRGNSVTTESGGSVSTGGGGGGWSSSDRSGCDSYYSRW